MRAVFRLPAFLEINFIYFFFLFLSSFLAAGLAAGLDAGFFFLSAMGMLLAKMVIDMVNYFFLLLLPLLLPLFSSFLPLLFVFLSFAMGYSFFRINYLIRDV
jgi:hypothetical protein